MTLLPLLLLMYFLFITHSSRIEKKLEAIAKHIGMPEPDVVPVKEYQPNLCPVCGAWTPPKNPSKDWRCPTCKEQPYADVESIHA